MAVVALKHIRVFLISEGGSFAPLSGTLTGDDLEVDTADFLDGVWGLFAPSGGTVIRTDGDLDLHPFVSGGVGQNSIGSESFRLWHDLGGMPYSFAGTYVTIGLQYQSSTQSGVVLDVDATISGDGYIAAVGTYDTPPASAEVFWAIGPYGPVPEPEPEPEPLAEFWTNFIGSAENI